VNKSHSYQIYYVFLGRKTHFWDPTFLKMLNLYPYIIATHRTKCSGLRLITIDILYTISHEYYICFFSQNYYPNNKYFEKHKSDLFENFLQVLKRGGARILNYIRRIPLLSFSLSPSNLKSCKVTLKSESKVAPII
jgi:hypothetical protein